MTPQNLAIVLAPCLIWPPVSRLTFTVVNNLNLLFVLQTTNDALTLNMSLANMHSAIVEHLITFAERFFPGEVLCYHIKMI